jgi:hypothetical protein
MPNCLATLETELPGSLVCLTISSFCSGVQRLRRLTLVTTSTRAGVAEDIVISMVVFLFLSLRNTDGTVFQGANSAILFLPELSIAPLVKTLTPDVPQAHRGDGMAE